MHLYNLTLSDSSLSSSMAVSGNFTGTSANEVCVASPTCISLFSTANNGGDKMRLIQKVPTYAVVRQLAAFRLPGTSQDYLFVTADSGTLSVLQFSPTSVSCVIQQTFGKTGVRRIVPSQFLVADPKGRAVFVSAVDKHKICWIMNRDAAGKITINSPLEANKAGVLTMALAALDVGYENPVFAAIEVDYSESDQQEEVAMGVDNMEKLLTYYELDLGLNHVVRKWSTSIDPRSNFLLAVPGGTDGPSGVLVCSENLVTWTHLGFDSVSVPIPKRPSSISNHDDENTASTPGIIIVSAVVHKLKRSFFALLQTEFGDVFKVTMEYGAAAPDGTGGTGVAALKIKYFDTIPVSRSLCILKSGYLFGASEFGNHYFYQIENLGDDDDGQIEYSSADIPATSLITFTPRPLRNLSPVDELSSLSPLIEAKLSNLAGEETPQIYSLCGKGARSSFRVLRHGIEVSEVAVSELPGNPSAVWTVKTNVRDEFDAYIVVSFINATLVLSIGDTVEEVTDSGFLGTCPTLIVGQLGENALVQVHTHGIRHIRADKRVSEWPVPGGRIILKAACNQKQVVIALSSGELAYFELDTMGNLNEYPERKEMTAPVTCLALGPVPDGKLRSKFLAVGCEDNTVRLYSLDPASCLQSIGIQALQSSPESITLTFMSDTLESSTAAQSSQEILFMHIGLSNGILVRSHLDAVTGSLSDLRSRFIGARACSLSKIRLGAVAAGGSKVGVVDQDTFDAGSGIMATEGNAVLVLSSRPWIGFVWKGKSRLVPLSYESLEHGGSFSSAQCPEGIVAVTGNTLRILTVDKLDGVFNEGVVPLTYTPRRMALHEQYKNFVIVESDYGVLSKSASAAAATNGSKMDEDVEGRQMEESEEDQLPVEQFGLAKAANPEGKWASCIRLLDPFKGETLSLFEMEDNEAAFCVTTINFSSIPDSQFVAVGTAKNVILSPRSCSSGYIRVYKYIENGEKLELVHVTPIEGIPNAIAAFQGRLIVGMGSTLRIYDIGKKKLLRKCESRQFPHCITNIKTHAARIIVTDVQESILFCHYNAEHNQIIPFADDIIPRWMTSFVMLDYDTVCGGDKFGNLFVLRLESSVSDGLEEDPMGNKLLFEKGIMNGCAHKLQHLCEYNVGETITSLHRTVLVPGGREVIVYTTFLGTIGILVPFVSKEDVEFFTTLEMHMRQEMPSILGRDHLSYRSYYIPVRKVVDGDFCEQFQVLAPEKRRRIAEEMDRSVAEIMKKLEDIRNRVAF